MDRAAAISLLPQTTAGTKLVLSSIGMGTNPQLVKDILGRYNYCVEQAQKLAPRFNKGSLEATAQAVWNFLKTQIQYKEDSGLLQHIKAPNALVSSGFGDCKSYSLFAAAIMANLGYPVTFRFAGYGGANYPGHVYILAGKKGQQVIIDGVYKKFNAEKTPYSYKKDYPMEIAYIGSIGCPGCAGNCNCNGVGKIQLGKAVKKAATAVKAAAKTATTAVKTAATPLAKKALKVVTQAAGVAPRTAFLQLVKLNVHSFATRLSKNRDAALAKWAQLGGNKGELNASINAGQNRQPILGFETEVQQGVGSAAVGTAAILAAAAPIIVAFASLLKDKNTAPATPATDGSPAPTSSGNTATEVLNAASNILEKFTGPKNAPANNTTTTSSAEYSGSADYAAPAAAAAMPGADSTGGGNGNKWLLPAAILLGILLLK